MSNLVTDFLINPVLRQARRFSSTNIDRVSPTNQQVQDVAVPQEAGLQEAPDVMSTESLVEGEESVSGRPIVASPIQEDGGLDEELVASWRTRSRPGTIDPPSAVPLRLASYRSDRMSLDGDFSDNPSYGVPGRFQNPSPMSSSFSSSTHNRTTSPADPPRSTDESSGTRKRNGSLPEDDGMSSLRRKIIAIQKRNISAGEKARLMHQLLTEGYSQSQISQNMKMPLRAQSPTGMVNQERPITPASRTSFSFWQTTATDTPPESSPSSFLNAFHLSQEDLKPTYAPLESPPGANFDIEESDDVEFVQPLGCRHYRRNVKLQCFTCGGWYTCRFCHDEIEDHILPRKETRNMLCMLCSSAQPVSDICASCGVKAARYYCGICKLWDDDANKSIYHCADCGICRVGRGIGKDFVHCKASHESYIILRCHTYIRQTCGVCVSIANENSHKCIERASDCDCPICGEYLFSSLQSVVFMKCGHSIHRKCHDELMKTSYKCPICNQSVVNMEIQFRALDRAIESQPMPPEFQDTKAVVSCNDCYAKCMVKYHWLGLKCSICDSYNTAQLQILSDGEIEESTDMGVVDAENSQQLGDSNLPLDSQMHFPDNPRPARSRRHSSHIWLVPPATESNSLRFSPYYVPQRMGRSVSPFRSSGFPDDPMSVEATVDAVEPDDEEDDVDFWGGDAPRSPRSVPWVDRDMAEEEDDEDSDDESIPSTVEFDDDDEEDRMDLIGHR